MLFNSYPFILLFLPIVVIGWDLALRWGSRKHGLAWLVLCSLLFYAWWNPANLPLLVASVTLNFLIGHHIAQADRKKPWLVTGIVLNLSFLGYYKYSGFAASILHDAVGLDSHWSAPALPLAISFFTFQQIAYLTSVHAGRLNPPPILDYVSVVTFFPHLIAGPIVHYSDVLPQLRANQSADERDRHRAIGITLFAIGLFKKVMIADPLGTIASPFFDQPKTLSQLDALAATLSYTFQIYFDFSGYSDMALGLAHIFGITFPANFSSPYKATSMIEFWRRWHISLSTFLRDHIFIPLGGSRGSFSKTLRNLFVTMLLGGLWHGAGWTFVLWGAAHGSFVAINHTARRFEFHLPMPLGWLVTFVGAALAWVLFRAPTFDAALSVYGALFDWQHLSSKTIVKSDAWLRIGLSFPIVLLLPNAVQFCRDAKFLASRPLAFATGLATVTALVTAMMHLNTISEFLYFNF